MGKMGILEFLWVGRCPCLLYLGLFEAEIGPILAITRACPGVFENEVHPIELKIYQNAR